MFLQRDTAFCYTRVYQRNCELSRDNRLLLVNNLVIREYWRTRIRFQVRNIKRNNFRSKENITSIFRAGSDILEFLLDETDISLSIHISTLFDT